jgi:hypothetical protein
MDDGCKNGMAVGGMEKVVIRHAQLAADSGSPFPFRFFSFLSPVVSYPTFISPFSLDDILCC